MLRVALALAALCGGCFTKPDFSGGDDDHSGDGGVDARRDAPPGGYMDAPDAPPGCTTIINEPFTTMPADPCMPWGARITGNAVIMRSGGMLHMAGPTPSTGFNGGCQSNAFDASKATVKVQLVNAPVGGAYWSTTFALTNPSTLEATSIHVNVSFNPMMMGTFIAMSTHAGDVGTFAYANTAVQYLRFQAINATTLHGEYSLDGTTWSGFGDDTYPQPLGNMTLAMRVSAMGNDSQQAIWDDLSVVSCP